MSVDVQKFYELLSKDETLIAQLKEKAENVSNEDELVSFLENELTPAAKKRGLNITLEDVVNYEKEKLEMDDLDNISGGISAKLLLTSGGIFSLLLGAGFGAAQTHADVPQDVVIKSANELSSAK